MTVGWTYGVRTFWPKNITYTTSHLEWNCCVTMTFELCQTGCYNKNNDNNLRRVFSLLITITLKAEPEGTLRLKVNLTGYWLVGQCYKSHEAHSVDQTSLPLCLFETKLNTYSHKQQSEKRSYLRNYIKCGFNKSKINGINEFKQRSSTSITNRMLKMLSHKNMFWAVI